MDNFSQPAFSKIEIVAGIHIFHSLVCGEMNASAAELLYGSREDTTGQLQQQQKTADGSSRDVIRNWLDGKSESTQPLTWEVLLKLFRDMRMHDVADRIERLFIDKEAYVRLLAKYKTCNNKINISVLFQTEIHYSGRPATTSDDEPAKRNRFV